MRLQIFDSILNGSIPINCNNDIPNYDKIAYLFSVEAKDKSSAEQTLAQILGGRLTLDFSIQDEADINIYIDSVSYTPIPSDYASVSVPVVLTDRTTHERYFKALLRLESARIKFTLIDYANTVKDDQRTGNEVSQTIKAIGKLASQAEEEHRLKMHPDLNHDYEDWPEFYDNITEPTSRIYTNYITALTSLYLELSIMFEEILSPSSYLSLDDFYSRRLNNRPVPKDIRCNYEVALQLHRTQVALRSNDIKQIQAVLVSNYEGLPKIKSKQFVAETTSLENRLFLLTCLSEDDEQINNFASIKEANDFITKYKSNLLKQLMEQENAREILLMLAEIEAHMKFFDDNAASTKSVPREILAFIKSQVTIYEKNISSPFSTTTTPKQTKSKPLGRREVKKLLDNAYKKIAFMSGTTHDGKQIMTTSDFALLQSYLRTFYETGNMPNVPNKLRTNTTMEYIRYTFYLIYKENDSVHGNGKRGIYVELLHTIFHQFSNIDQTTTSKKFSTEPNTYFKDIGR